MRDEHPYLFVPFSLSLTLLIDIDYSFGLQLSGGVQLYHHQGKHTAVRKKQICKVYNIIYVRDYPWLGVQYKIIMHDMKAKNHLMRITNLFFLRQVS